MPPGLKPWLRLCHSGRTTLTSSIHHPPASYLDTTRCSGLSSWEGILPRDFHMGSAIYYQQTGREWSWHKRGRLICSVFDVDEQPCLQWLRIHPYLASLRSWGFDDGGKMEAVLTACYSVRA